MDQRLTALSQSCFRPGRSTTDRNTLSMPKTVTHRHNGCCRKKLWQKTYVLTVVKYFYLVICRRLMVHITRVIE